MKVFIVFSMLLVLAILAGTFATWKKKAFPYHFMDKTHTQVMKGLAIFSVMWAHCGAGAGISGIQFIAGAGVSLFLLCSGYGLMCSYQKNGLQHYWRKRIWKVLLPCWIVLLLAQIAGKTVSFQKLLWNVVLLRDANWFVCYILVCYVLFWCACAILGKKKEKMLFLLSFFFVVWFFLESCIFADSSIPFLKARQMLSFPGGVALCIYKEQIEAFLHRIRAKSLWACGMILTGCILQVVTYKLARVFQTVLLSNFMYLIVNVILTVGVFLIMIQWNKILWNPVTYWIGEVSFEIFLLHFYVIYKIKTIPEIFLYMGGLVIAVWMLFQLDQFLIRKSIGKK